jgi:hypothetical protein
MVKSKVNDHPEGISPNIPPIRELNKQLKKEGVKATPYVSKSERMKNSTLKIKSKTENAQSTSSGVRRSSTGFLSKVGKAVSKKTIKKTK